MSEPCPLRIRSAVARMRPYHPPVEGRHGLRLDFNENTVGCSARVLAALRAVTAEDLARYPEYQAAEMEIAAAFGHTPDSLVVTNGVDDAILLTVQTLVDAGDEIVIVEPTFAMYRFYAEQAGARLQRLRYRDEHGADGGREFRLDLHALGAAIGPRTRVVFLANPNNPTGSYAPPEELVALARRRPTCAFFIDEAYGDFVAGAAAELIRQAGAPPNLLVARTFSKLYGLAGARLGVLAAHPELMAAMRKVHSPYSVNTLALVAARAALGDREWALDYRRQVIESRARIERALSELGIPWWRSAANFVLFEAGLRADALLAAGREQGILLRDRRADLPGAVRITCGTLEQTERALDLLRSVWRRGAAGASGGPLTGRGQADAGDRAEEPHPSAAAPGAPGARRAADAGEQIAAAGDGAARQTGRRSALVFDLDGVLVDVSRSYRRAIGATVRELGGGEVAAEEVQALKDAGGFNNDWDLVEELLRRRNRPAPRERIVAVFNSLYRGANDDGLMLEEEWLLPAPQLAALRATYRLAIFTGRPRADAEFVLRRFGVAEMFERVLALEDVRQGKPHPEGLLALAQFFAPAAIRAYIGDTVDDAACARGAQIPFLGIVLPGHPRPELARRRFAELGCLGAATDVAAALELLPEAPEAQPA